MRAPHFAIAAALIVAANPAAAQLSNHAVAIEGGLRAPADDLRDVGGGVAVTASRWIDGDVEAVARVAFTSAAETGGRAATSTMSGVLGLRLSLMPDPVRPQVEAEIGWARVAVDGAVQDRLAVGICAGVEWFTARDRSVALRIALRGRPSAPAAEATLAAAIYF